MWAVTFPLQIGVPEAWMETGWRREGASLSSPLPLLSSGGLDSACVLSVQSHGKTLTESDVYLQILIEQ